MIRPKINGSFGDEIESTRGVRQGRRQSMQDFRTILADAMEPLVKCWSREGYGVQIGIAL